MNGIDPDGPMGPSPGVPELGYGPINLTDYSDTVTNSGKFIQATYPVAGGKFINEEKQAIYYGSSQWPVGVLKDLLTLYLWAQLERVASIAVGIVPNNYFDYHYIGAYGITFRNIPAVLVEVDYWTVAAHEIGIKCPNAFRDAGRFLRRRELAFPNGRSGIENLHIVED